MMSEEDSYHNLLVLSEPGMWIENKQKILKPISWDKVIESIIQLCTPIL